MKKIVEIKDGVLAKESLSMRSPINLTIYEGEHVAIVGNNGSGKSRLADVLSYSEQLIGDSLKYDFSGVEGSHLISDNVRYIAFKDSYGPIDNNYFLQQRWECCFIDEEATPTVRKSLGLTFEMSQYKNVLLDIFGLEPLMDKYVISLSSGELRKLKFAKALIKNPRVLIIDNPFIGLDTKTREEVTSLLDNVIKRTGLTVMLVLSKPDLIPDFITHVIPVKDMEVLPKQTISEYRKNISANYVDLEEEKVKMIIDLPEKKPDDFYLSNKSSEIINCRNVKIQYDDRIILKDLNWVVKEGEKWVLTGKNGSGKSTLLSLICADNPQSYACDIDLFSHKRGTGESIWEIKKYIGYVSPELQRAYLKDIPAIRIVSSGLFDTIGLFKTPSEEQCRISEYWMSIFGILHLADRSYISLSDGEQRLCLLARAFVKDPELLILDEPFHGLDAQQCHYVKEIINLFMQRKHKTLIFVSHFESEFPSCITNKIELIHH